MCQVRRLFVINLIILAIFSIVFVKFKSDNTPSNHYVSESRTSSRINDKLLNKLVNDINIVDFQSVLKPILIQRVVGTKGHERVKNYIIDKMNELKWTIENDTFHDFTPERRKLLFTNIIATYNPDAPEFLVLACHYDSKMSDFAFIGATDSAVPCAMLIYLAQNMAEILTELNQSISLKLIFFDGEEAFIDWSETDSLYGARHLAKILEQKRYSVDSSRSINELQRMTLFVLLDLLGAPSPTFYSYFRNTDTWYLLLVSTEKQLQSKGLLRADTGRGPRAIYFREQAHYHARIDDDHKPFLIRGVPVLHVIPTPFPDVWHTKDDNETAINYDTVFNLLGIFKVFVFQYLASSN